MSMSDFLRDLRFGLRMLVKRPGTSALAVIALALGIGLTTTMFSIVNAAFLRGLPFDDAGKIVYVGAINAQNPDRPNAFNVHDFVDIQKAQTSFVEFAGFAGTRADLIGEDQIPQRYEGQMLTPNALTLMRIAPVVGRGFTEADAAPGAPKVLIIHYRIWVNRFQKAPDIVNRVVRLNGEQATIIGVMPDGFGFPQTGEIWTPLTLDLPAKRSEGISINGLGRLKSGVSLANANTELKTIAARLAAAYPENKDRTAGALPFVRRYMGAQVVTTLSSMLAAVFGVMLIACVNVTNLQLARAADRTKEIAVRLAMGASRARLVRQLLYEGVLLASAGALVGLAIAQVGVVMFSRGVEDTGKPFWIDVKLDLWTLLFVMAITIVAAVASSLVPALRVTRNALADVLKDEGRGGTSLRVGKFSRILVVAQMTLSFALLLTSGLMAKSIAAVTTQVFPFRTDVRAGRIDFTGDQYKSDDALRAALERVDARVREIPGVTAVAFSNGIPSQVGGPSLEIEGIALPKEGTPPPSAERLIATPSFFDALKMSMLQGRRITDDDRAGGDLVAVVSPEFVSRYLQGREPIGQRLRMGTDGKQPWRRIVGVMQSLGTRGRNGDQVTPAIVFPFAQGLQRNAQILVASSGAPVSEGQLRYAVAQVDPDLVMFDVNTVQGRFDQQTWPFKVFGSLIVAFGSAALVLASAGLYGVMAFAVRRRMSEIGVRMALGASQKNILGLVMRQGSVMVAAGMIPGVLIGIGLGKLLTVLMYGVKPYDPMVLGGTFLVLALSGLLACLVPARRAAGVDPLIALRRD
ncbi:MAG: ABC transporter permease [Acidobacteria bacterium]|nr:MAG: ABC transporter permease [Acidobacteriota bacterium]